MWLIPKGDLSPGTVVWWLQKKIESSRFTADVSVKDFRKRTPAVKVSCVRLKNKKSYCGAHPGPCQANGGRKRMNARYLEGLDWVGFNALLNDVLDGISADCTVFSYNNESLTSRYYIRLGTRRRVQYPYKCSSVGGIRWFTHWTQDKDYKTEDFQDYCGKSPPAVPCDIAMSGTPGYPCYTLAEEEKYRGQEEGTH
jgi:hypothetical protein